VKLLDTTFSMGDKPRPALAVSGFASFCGQKKKPPGETQRLPIANVDFGMVTGPSE
jgi:hypothetical protein